ncbi:MAG: DUF362 domain-containing protein [Planctomycetales bacterium]|nr:DUF362 domain-containing protein [Planctomycetales bacterium]
MASVPSTTAHDDTTRHDGPSDGSLQCDRRALLVGGASALATAGLAWLGWQSRPQTPVFLAGNQRYDQDLTRTIRDGLLATGLQPESLQGKRVLIKPNLVEPLRSAPQITTHPAVIVAAADVFRAWGARVTVGEAPGHIRDTEMAVEESGVREALVQEKLSFADLNYEDVRWVRNRGRASKLDGFYFPLSVATADLIVSIPKLKCHHWVGMTAALKNMYGVIPGIVYGWPKNVLHHAGIPETIFDINASLPPMIGIVDGIVAMEGDGPIMGSAKEAGLIGISTNATALDATLARAIGLAPDRMNYLKLANRRLGPIAERSIVQRGDTLQACYDPFYVIDKLHLQCLRST